MRKVGWAVDYLNEAESLVSDPEQKQGLWKPEGFKGKLHVEIGTGKGGYSLEMARMHPEDVFVAVEKNESAAGIAAKKFDEAGLDNLFLIHQDARDLTLWFAQAEADVIHLNFSDPWPKKRNAKRRLSADSFLAQYDQVLADDGQIQMKTDNPSLYEYSVLNFLKSGWLLEDMSVDFRREPHPEDAVTEYEQKFMEEGKPVYRCVWRKHEDA
jgi:tRNA (guanine-N7-)-methyltransferase